MPVFDGYRTFAIFGIVFFHLTALAPFPAGIDGGVQRLLNSTVGQLVDVLFIVSGFVVFLPTAARGRFGSVPRYAIRRAARLLPAYYVVLIFAFLLVGARMTTDTAIAFHAVGLGSALSFFPDLGHAGFGRNGPLWTLSVEIGFYVVLPFVAMAFYRRPRIGLAVGAAISILWIQFGINVQSLAGLFGLDLADTTADRIGNAIGTQFPFWAFSFALGMAGAKAFVVIRENWTEEEIKRRTGRALFAGLAGLVVFAVWMYLSPQDLRSSLVAERLRYSPPIMIGASVSLAVVMVSLSFASSGRQWLFANRGVRWLAEISYGVYLSHAVFVYYSVWHLWWVPDNYGRFLQQAACIAMASIIYGYLSARLLEQPIRRLAQRYGNRV